MLHPGRDFKDAIYEQLARVGKAVSSPKRLELLDLLCQGPRTVEALAKQVGASVANASQHLRVLRGARLVTSEKRGLYVEYQLADDGVADFFVTLRTLAETRLAEVDQVTREFFASRESVESVEAVDAEELARRVEAGEVTLLDVRPSEEYRAGHLPGALSMPVTELHDRLGELPDDRPIVAYCRGPYCVMALEAVELLRERGFEAHRTEHGVADWRARGLAVETTP